MNGRLTLPTIAGAVLLGALALAAAATPAFAQTAAGTAPGVDQCSYTRETLAAVSIPPLPELPFSGFITYLAAPLVALAAVVNLLTAAPFGELANLIRGALTEPGLLLFQRRRSGFGTVYESLSKKPVDLALVRVIDDGSGKVVLTRVTDREGRFTSFVPAGRYRFAVVKRGYTFPTALLVGETFDPAYGPITTGHSVEHNSRGPLEVNLPVDAPEDTITTGAAIRRHLRRGMQQVFAYSGIALGALAVLLVWNWQTWALLGLHVLLFLMFKRLTDRSWGRRWGIIRDARSAHPLQRSVVRLVDARFGRVVETQVVDRRGQYGFAVGKSRFRLFTDREKYEPYRSDPFDVGREGVVYRDVDMRYTGGTP